MGWFSDFFKTSSQRYHEAVSKFLDHAQAQQATIQQQADVIAAQATPQNAPQAPIARPPVLSPVPMTEVTPAVDPAAPWGYTVGPNGKVANTGPNLGFGWDGFGTPNKSQAEADRSGNLAQWQKDEDAARYGGPVPISSLTDAEKSFLLYAEENYNMAYRGVFYAVCNGSKHEIDQAISWADNHRGQIPTAQVISQGNVRLGGYVDAFSKGQLKPVYLA